MALGNQVPDKTLLRNVERKLVQKCGGGVRVAVTVRSGDVTVSGIIKNEYDRKPITRCVSAVQGVRRVVDQLRVAERQKPVA